MDEILGAIGDALGGVVGNPLVEVGLRLAAAYLVLVWLAAALWAFVDMRRRSMSQVAPYASAALVIVASPLLFPFAVLVHRVVRPGEFRSDRQLSEVRDRALEVEVTVTRCPECRLVVADDWLLCPGCRQPLAHRCHACGGTVGLDWGTCAWCATDLERGLRPSELRQA